MMVTTSEQQNIEETFGDDDPRLKRSLSINTGFKPTPDVYVDPIGTGLMQPQGLIFPYTDHISNGLSSRLVAGAYGINDFTAYNPYIHHVFVGDPSAGVLADLGSLGNVVQNFTTVNVMANIVLASNRFEIYSRQYRGTV